MSDLAAPYRSQRERLDLAIDEVETLRTGLAEEREALPGLQDTCEAEIFPKFRNWTADLRRAIQPVYKIKTLRKRARSMRGLMRLVLSNGRAIRVLLGNALLRLAILLVFLLKLGLLALIIWGAIKAATWLSEVL